MKIFISRGSLWCAIAAFGLSVCAAKADTATPSFNGCVSDPPQSAGLYSFPTSSYAPEQIKRNIYASGGGIADDNYYYSVHYEVIGGIPVIECTSYSLKNWGVEDHFTNCKITNVATDLAYFAPRDEAYGCYFNESGTGYVFGKSKLSQFSCDKIADLEIAFAAMDFDAKGTLYAIDWTGKLHTVNTSTGALTLIGDTGKTTSMITGGVIDRESGVFYFSVCNDAEHALYAVNLETAKATKVYDLENNEQLGGMYYPVTYASAAPAASGNPSLSFSGTALNGTVRFRAPQKSVGNDLLEGAVTYHVEANGKEVATGTASYSDGFFSVPVEVEAPGRYCFSLYFSNEAGRGPRSKVTQYIGPDVPKAPGSPRMTYKSGTVKLFWTAAGSTGVNGGNIDRSNMYYKITRLPDGEVFSADASGWSQELAIPAERTTYRYEIRTVAGGLESEPAYTPDFSLGTIIPPFAEDFATQNSTIGWTWINNDSYIDDNYTSSGMRLVTMNGPDEGTYLATPPMNLKAGSKYEISLSLKRGNSSYTEQFEVIAGEALTPESLGANVIIPSATLEESDYKTFTATFEPSATGTYYLALHGIESGRMIYMKSFSISKGVASGTPGAVTNLSVIPAQDGSHSVAVKFNVPSVDLDGNVLTEVTSAELLRDGESIKTVDEGLNPGAEIEMADDTNPATGEHVYTVVCHNSAGNGIPVSQSVWVGFNVPEPVEWVNVKETSTLGTVIVSWAPATEDIDGKSLADAKVTYNLYDRNYELIKTGLEETSMEIRAQEPQAPQNWAQYRVTAVSEGGESDLAKSILVPVGPADKAPYRESWAGKEASHLVGTTQNSVGDTWMVVGGFSYNGRDVDPQDNDGGMMGLENTVPDETISMFTAKIDLSEVSAPALSFWVFNYIGDNGKDNANEIEVKVLGDNDDDFKHLQTVIIGQTGPQRQWNKVTIPLTGYEGQTVRLRLEATVITAIYVHVDNIEVDTSSPCNLAASGISAPASVNPDQEYDIVFTVHNNGDSDIENAEAVLMRNGEQAQVLTLGKIASGERRNVTFKDKLSVLDADVISYVGKAVAEGDLVNADNETAVASVALRRNGTPVVKTLSATPAGSGITLEWTAPDMSEAAPEAVTEGFEKAAAWKSEVTGWTFLDLDRATIGGIGKKQLPVSGQQSFFVIDDTYKELNDANSGTRFKAHDGTRCLWSMYSMRGNTYVQSDDWAIAPELYGGPQTISLWASSFEADKGQSQYLESFEVLGSSTGLDTDDFELIAHVDNVPAKWTNYEFYLPAGTRYLAIRGVSYDKYLLMIDDVKFTPAGGAPRALTLAGYHIYRDGKRITTAPVAGNSFVDTDVVPNQTYSYRITANYNAEGESAPSDEAIVMAMSGVGSLSGSAVSVYARDGYLNIAGAEGMQIAVASVDGLVVAVEDGKELNRIPVASGVYIVTVGNRTFKVICR